MFKILIKSSVVGTLLLVNMAVLTWWMNYFEWHKPELKNTLINNVQANYTPKNTIVEKKEIKVIVDKNHIIRQQSIYSQPRLKLVFAEKSTQLKVEEQSRLKDLLQDLNVDASYTVKIFTGPALGENNMTSPHIAKLRAQTVARFIYPHTQNVVIYYRPTMEIGYVAAEFVQLKAQSM